MLKDIIERPSSKSGSAPLPPSAPSPPSRSATSVRGTGFPIAVHRSQRGPSAFARARQQQAARENGQDHGRGQSQSVVAEGKAVDVIPSLSLSSPSASSSSSSIVPPRQDDDAKPKPLSEVDEVRRAVDAENIRRVQGMTPSEREDEISELEERFGSNILSFMRKRRHARLSTSDSEPSAENTTEDGPSSRSTAQMPALGQTIEQALGDAESILRDVDQENRRRVEGINGLEREQEVEELQERFGASLMDALRKRAEKRVNNKGKEKEKADGPSVAAGLDSSSSSSATAPQSIAVPPSSAPAPKTHSEDPSLSDLKAYFPSVPSETSKLAWLQPVPQTTSQQSTATRFDLSGNVLSSAAQTDLPSHLGLHHHGSSPDLAGYTISDILYLCRSTVPSQRITMMGVLSKILINLRDDQSISEATKKEVEDAEARKRAIELGIEVLAGLTRGVGVIEAGIELLYEALAGPSWTSWLDDDPTTHESQAFKPDEEKETGISSIPFEDVLPRVTELLSLEDGISPRTVHQLISILRRATYLYGEICETICTTLPTIIKQHVIQRVWPPKSTETQAGSRADLRYPSLDALRLLQDITTSSRACAEELLGQGVYETTLRFVVTATWETSESTDSSIVHHGQSLASVVLETYSVLGRYGLSSSIVTSSPEIWRLLGAWVERQSQPSSLTPPPISRRLVRAYFKCLGIWITCAVDPHRTTPEHDLTWAQVDAMKWQEEAVTFIQNIENITTTTDDAKSSTQAAVHINGITEIIAAVAMLNLWAKGVTVNGVKNGEQEKAAVQNGLKESRMSELVDGLLPLDNDMDEKQEEFLAACVQLHDHLEPVGELLGREILDNLRQRYLTKSSINDRSPRGSSRAATYIQYHLVQLDIRAAPDSSTTSWLSSAFNLFQSFTTGDEPLALDLLDAILKINYTASIQHFTSLSISHSDGLQLLRPLLQYTILPNVEHIVAPYQPSHLYLKATSTLRSSTPRISDEKPALPGLPLQADWMFSPLNELLRSGTSDALAQVPPDWQASEVEIVQASLILAVLAYGHEHETSTGAVSDTITNTNGQASKHEHVGTALLRTGLDNEDRSRIILNLMKVHMLEHGQTTSNTANEVEVFRDPLVSDLMKEMMAWITRPLLDDGGLRKSATSQRIVKDGSISVSEHEGKTKTLPSAASVSASAPLERVAIPFLGTGVPFYQFYADFVALYVAISFSDPLFSQLLLAPLSMDYPADYRRLVWNDHSSVLRGISLKYSFSHTSGSGSESEPGSGSGLKEDDSTKNQIPVENGERGVRTYFKPLETDQQVLSSYARALTQGLVNEQRNPLLYDLAFHHLAGLFWNEKGEEARDSVRVGLLVTVLAGGNDGLVKSILEWDLSLGRGRGKSQSREAEEGEQEDVVRMRKEKRKGIVGKLAGPRGTKRVENL
ncbi:hypothetical protein IAT40_000065 [Kwoniella sp. CBS 6097]